MPSEDRNKACLYRCYREKRWILSHGSDHYMVITPNGMMSRRNRDEY